jgi:hypothetical protein
VFKRGRADRRVFTAIEFLEADALLYSFQIDRGGSGRLVGLLGFRPGDPSADALRLPVLVSRSLWEAFFPPRGFRILWVRPFFRFRRTFRIPRPLRTHPTLRIPSPKNFRLSPVFPPEPLRRPRMNIF